jgi:hypothetical protein
MPRRKSHAHLLEFAKRGAQAQLGDLLHEIKMLVELFPHLRDSLDADELPLSFLLKKGSEKGLLDQRSVGPAAAPAAKRRKLSAAARKAISDAQKKRWALHNANKKK